MSHFVGSYVLIATKLRTGGDTETPPHEEGRMSAAALQRDASAGARDADARDLAAYAELLLYYLNSTRAAGDPARRDVTCAARDMLLDLQAAARIGDAEATAIVTASHRAARRRARRLGERVSGWYPVPHGLTDLIDLATAQVAVWARSPAAAAAASDDAPSDDPMPNAARRHEALA